MNDNELLYDLYYNKHNYDGVNMLFAKAKKIHPLIKKEAVVDWLNEQQSYAQTKTKVGKKIYLPIYSESPYAFQMDLTFFPRYIGSNNGYDVLFTAINVNTRFAYAYYSTDKSMPTILNFLKKMEEKTVINTITCDEGTEFKNKEFTQFCQDNNITIYFVKGDSHKLGIINRFHRTIKDKLSKHFIATRSKRWIDVIDSIINNYNTTVNRGIGVAPKDVNNAMEMDIINEMRDKTDDVKEDIEIPFEVGDLVLIKRKKELFDDKLLSKYLGNTYTVERVLNNSLDLDSHGDSFRVKKSDVLKIKPSGLITPEKIETKEEEKVEDDREEKLLKRRERELRKLGDFNSAGQYYKNELH